MIKNITIFDLDGTVIDSTHRQVTRSDGTLDVANWLQNSTPEKIFGDTVLPLAQQVNNNMTFADFEFLMDNGINPDKIISRPIGDNTPDGELKAKQLKQLFNLKQFQKANKVMFDDAPSVRASLRKIGVACIDPQKIARRVA